MSENRFRVVYDSVTSTLYVTADRASASGASADATGRPSQYGMGGDALVGVKTVEFDAYWGDRFDALPGRVPPCRHAAHLATARRPSSSGSARAVPREGATADAS